MHQLTRLVIYAASLAVLMSSPEAFSKQKTRVKRPELRSTAAESRSMAEHAARRNEVARVTRVDAWPTTPLRTTGTAPMVAATSADPSAEQIS